MILVGRESLRQAIGVASDRMRWLFAPSAGKARTNATGIDRPTGANIAAPRLATISAVKTVIEGARFAERRRQAAGPSRRMSRGAQVRSALADGARLFRHSAVAFGLALILSFWIAALTLVCQDRAALRIQMQRDAGNLALVFEENVAHTVADLDRGLLFLRWAHAHAPASVDWADIVGQDFVSNRETAQTSVIDGNGFMVTSSALLHPRTPIYLGDSERFQACLKRDGDFLFIGRPLPGQASGKWSVQFARKLMDADGRFAGVVAISMDASRLPRNYGELDLGPGGGLALVGDDGILRAGSGIFADVIGRPFATTADGAPPRTGPPYDSGANPGGLTTVERPVAGAPLKVVVAVPDESNNARWSARRHSYYAAALGASLLALFATIAVAVRRYRSEARIRYLARYDALTALANRRQLGEHLDALFAFDDREHGHALHIIDLNRFKFINDIYGHPFGDMLLKRVADRLLALARPSDLVARLGGDEFAIVQSLRFAQVEARALAERICRELAEPFEIGHVRVVIGATVGIGSAADGANSAGELLKAADLALYAAKAAGKGGYRFYDASMTRAVHARTDIENGLRNAIDNEELRLFYQPIVSLTAQKTVGYEALIRWIRPELGIVSPLDFIPVAEETGLIVKIGEWALERACSDIAALRAPMRVAVNCSPLQFELADVAASVQMALSRSGLEPNRLEIEITESALMKNNQRVLDQLRRLRAIGVRVSLDDFGTGFSSSQLPRTLSHHHDQDRPLVRPEARTARGRPGDRPRDRRACLELQDAGSRRRGRDGGAAEGAGRPRLHPRARLSVRQAAADLRGLAEPGVPAGHRARTVARGRLRPAPSSRPLPSAQASASARFNPSGSALIARSSVRAGPLGRLAPRSHSCTVRTLN